MCKWIFKDILGNPWIKLSTSVSAILITRFILQLRNQLDASSSTPSLPAMYMSGIRRPSTLQRIDTHVVDEFGDPKPQPHHILRKNEVQFDREQKPTGSQSQLAFGGEAYPWPFMVYNPMI
ncbi:hypothetical protein M422DRAFT_42242 [Sphaerobolus stellatus SS14]|nr:hypothetical protein M422DRAFT_42242 [Sphaerobolus stellatus SS14]